MTLRGIIVIIAEVILVIFALGTEFNKILMLAACVGGVIIYSFISLLLATITLNVKSNIDKKTVFRSDTVKYTLSLYGIALLPISSYFFIKFTERKLLKKNGQRHTFLLLPSFSVRRNFTFEFDCEHIGEWEMGIKKMRLQDLFGLFSFPLIRARRSDFSIKVSVMPNVHDLSMNKQRDSIGGTGITSVKCSEDGELLGDTRLYREGDSLKRINWKQSARTKKLYSRMYEVNQGPRAVIVVDTAVLGEGIDKIIDITSEAALSLAEFFMFEGNFVSVITVREQSGNETTDYNIESSADVIKLRDIFINMPFSTANEELELSAIQNEEIMGADRIYFITSNPGGNLVNAFENINKSGKVACCIVPTAKPVEIDPLFSSKTSGIARVYINSADRIIEEVGAVL